jgi:hypothetical protein
MDNKRRSARIAITALAEATLPDGRNLSTYVANISREGLGIYFKGPLETGTEITITLTYHDETGKKKSKTVDGQVKWAYNGFHAVGVALKGLNEKEHGDLLKYIELVEGYNKQSG